MHAGTAEKSNKKFLVQVIENVAEVVEQANAVNCAVNAVKCVVKVEGPKFRFSDEGSE
jgi:hypothetical protein